jgi:hypothetical protein
MKHAPTIAAGLLGLIFVVFGLNFFFKFIPIPAAPEGSPPAMFLGAMYLTGYLAFIKVLEILGGLLVAIPKTRNIGLLVLAPIIVNILAFQVFLVKGAGLADPVIILITILPLFLLWTARKSFATLLR